MALELVMQNLMSHGMTMTLQETGLKLIRLDMVVQLKVLII